MRIENKIRGDFKLNTYIGFYEILPADNILFCMIHVKNNSNDLYLYLFKYN